MSLTGFNAPMEIPAGVQRIFVGTHGLRVGWRVLLFFVLSAVLAGVLIVSALPSLRRLTRPHPASILLPGSSAASNALLLAATVLATLLLARLVDHRPWGTYGLPLQLAFGRNFWIGVLIGFGSLTAQLFVMCAAGVFEFGAPELRAVDALRNAVAWALVFILGAMFEQLLFRGYSQKALAEGIGFWPAALVLSCLYAALHLGNAGENKFGIAAVVLAGMLYCFTLLRTGNLWLAVGFHASWDWAESFLFGVPDSGKVAAGHYLAPRIHGSTLLTGGTAGPEASIFALLSLGLAAAATAIMTTRNMLRSDP